MMHDSIDIAIIALIQGDLPLDPHPFAQLSQQLGIEVDQILQRIEQMRTDGVLRRWGAVLRHQQAGYIANAMVAWKVDPDKADEAGWQMAGFQEISHCYLRSVPAVFPYNLFTMCHARSEEQLQELINRAAAQTGLNDFVIIKSLREFKKTSMTYV